MVIEYFLSGRSHAIYSWQFHVPRVMGYAGVPQGGILIPTPLIICINYMRDQVDPGGRGPLASKIFLAPSFLFFSFFTLFMQINFSIGSIIGALFTLEPCPPRFCSRSALLEDNLTSPLDQFVDGTKLHLVIPKHNEPIKASLLIQTDLLEIDVCSRKRQKTPICCGTIPFEECPIRKSNVSFMCWIFLGPLRRRDGRGNFRGAWIYRTLKVIVVKNILAKFLVL